MEEQAKKIALILSYNHYPDKDAGAVRDIIFARMYFDMGYRVICVGKGTQNGVVNHVEYMAAASDANSIIDKLKQTKRYVATVKKMLQQYKHQIEVIHILDISLSLIQYIKRQKKRNGWQLIHDSVEWYSACEFKRGKLSRAYIHKDLLNRFVIDKKFKVVSISRYLFRYYTSKAIHTIRIPVLMNLSETNLKNEGGISDERSILYAGSPGKKDCLDVMLAGVKLLKKEEQEKIKFHIIGVNEQQLEQYISWQDYENLKDVIIVHGRRSREYVLEMLKKADFTILLRLNERYAHAGFSTKIVESLANGVPLICNLTSDMELFCEDGKNAICLKTASSHEFCEALRKYIHLSNEDIWKMSRYARKTAEEYFDARLFYDSFAKFIQD